MGKLINHGVFVEWQIYDVITSARQSRILVLAGISWITGYLQHTSRDELSCNKEVCRDQSQPNMLPEQLYFILICSFSFFFFFFFSHLWCQQLFPARCPAHLDFLFQKDGFRAGSASTPFGNRPAFQQLPEPNVMSFSLHPAVTA